ncbi:MAG: tetratricopeptide repeat protein [Thermoguttaceae bacterium]
MSKFPSKSGELYNEAVIAACEIDEPAERVNSLIVLARSMTKSGYRDHAESLLPMILQQIYELEDERESAYLCRLCLELQCDMGLLEDACTTFEHLSSGAEERMASIIILSRELIRAGKMEKAMPFLEEIDDLDDYESLLIEVGKCQLRNNDLDAALQTAKKMEIGETQTILLHEISIHLWNTGEFTRSVEFAEKALSLTSGITDSDKRDCLLKQISLTCFDGKQIFDRFIFINGITSLSLRVELCCHFALTAYQEKLRDKSKQKLTQKEDKQSPQYIQNYNNAIQRFHVSVESESELMINEAMQLLQKITDDFHKVAAMLQIAETMYLIGNHTSAKEMFQKSLVLITKLDNHFMRASSLIKMGEMLQKLARTESAKRMLKLAMESTNQINDMSIRLFVLLQIVETQIKFGFCEDAQKIINQVEELVQEESKEKYADDDSSGIIERFLTITSGRLAAALQEDMPQIADQMFMQSIQMGRSIIDPLHRTTALQYLAEMDIIFSENSDAEQNNVF